MSVREGVILLAEDDPNDVLLVQRAFQRTPVANPLQVVRDGEEALAYLSGQAPYADRERHPLPVLMLMDLKMPRKSGLEVLEWVRQQPGAEAAPDYCAHLLQPKSGHQPGLRTGSQFVLGQTRRI